MPLSFTQSDRPLQVSTGLGPGRMLVVEAAGSEAVNELFAFQLHLLAPNTLPPVEFDKVLGQPAAVRLRIPGTTKHRTVHGLVTALTKSTRDKAFTHYRADLRPAWWPATLRLNSRVFQQVTVVDILKTVLGPFGPLDNRLASQYPGRDYTVEYQESDWAFASRLMEEEGIFYYFRHADDGHTLVLADGLTGCPPVADPSPLEYDDTPGTDRTVTRPVAWRWDVTQELVPTQMITWDSHEELFRKNLSAEATQTAPVELNQAEYHPAPRGGPDIPVYRHDGDYAKRYDGVAPGGGDRSADLSNVYPDADRTARLRLAQASARAVRATGVCNAPHLVPGHVLTLSGHPDADDKYIVTRTTHAAVIPQPYWATDAAGEYEYTNEFEAAPTALIPRPPIRTPRPKVGGPLTALVVGPPGYHIYVDKYGRIKVQFWWDREGKFDADSSCWVRVSQLWAGKTWGAFFWPRVGMEVVVHFENGDPDRPLVTGCVYNAENLPPTLLPVEATIAGIKSHVPGGDPSAHFNAIYIHDTPGVEYIQLHSEKSEAQHSEGGKYHYTAGMKMDIRGRL